MSRLKSPVHVQQTTLGYCLPACGQMALDQLGLTASQAELARTLVNRLELAEFMSDDPISRAHLEKRRG